MDTSERVHSQHPYENKVRCRMTSKFWSWTTLKETKAREKRVSFVLFCSVGRASFENLFKHSKLEIPVKHSDRDIQHTVGGESRPLGCNPDK